MSSESGWFDAFRPNGGPPLYLDPNRTSSRIDSTIFFILLTFTTAEIAFLLVLPGIRKEKISTFIIVSLSLFVGCTITVAHCGSSWHVAEASISSPYRAFSKQKIFADVGVYIGLQSVNITLKAKATHHKKADEINYNERFYWIEATGMKQEYQNALAKGLPFPILTILEYLSKADEGFCWGEKYRGAGSLSSNLLVMAFCAWIFMWILLCAVPKYGIYALTGLGAFMLFINLCYSLSLPPNPLRIPFPGGVLGFTYGWSYWLTMGAGVTALSIGLIIIIFDYFFPNRFSTIMEVDYDTPYRYFVGNDAHLFGGLANNGTHNHNNPNHHHHHQIASITNSASTESTCCGNNTLRNGVIKSSSVSASSSTSLSLSSSSTKSPVSKQKSDASVCTTESYPVTLSSKNGHFNNTSSNSVSNTTTTTTRAIIEKQGQDNEAFDDENDDKLKTISDDKSVRKKNRVHPSSSSSTSTSIASTSSSGITSSSNNSSDPNEISTELVHGKRAVSLTNFGRFTARQHQLSLSKSQNCTKINTKLPNTHL